MGGRFLTVQIDPDQIYWFDLEDLLVRTKAAIKYDHALFLNLPDKMSVDGDLLRINDDSSILKMAEIGMMNRLIVMYVVKEVDVARLEWELSKGVYGSKVIALNGTGRKLTPKRALKKPLDIIIQKEVSDPLNNHTTLLD